MNLYRVSIERTTSVQPCGTFWNTEVIYCGPNKDEARIAYHTHTPNDYWQGYGNGAQETKIELISPLESFESSETSTSLKDNILVIELTENE